MSVNLYKKGNFSIRPKTYIDKEPDYKDLEIVKWNNDNTCYSICSIADGNFVSVGMRVFTCCDNSEEQSDLAKCVKVLYYLSRSDER